MNTDLVEKKGLEPLQPALLRIAALKDAHQLAALMGDLEAEGSSAPLFSFGVGQDDKDSSKQIAEIGQGGLSLPDRDYYIEGQQALSRDSRAVHRAHEEDVHPGRRHARAGSQGSRRGDGDRDRAGQGLDQPHRYARPEKRYHIYTVADFQKLTPDFDLAPSTSKT